MNFTKLAAQVWRQFVTDGVAGSGNRPPKKSEIITWGGEVEAAVSQLKRVIPVTSTINIALIMSQSNGLANEAAVGGTHTGTNAKVKAWAILGGSLNTATLGQDPFREDSGSGIPNNVLFQFGKRMQELTGANVNLVLHAIPDTDAVKFFTVANGGPNDTTNKYDKTTPLAGGYLTNPFQRKTQTIVEAFLAATGETRFDIVLMFKGENEEVLGPSGAETAYLTLVDQLEAESWVDSDTLIIACEMSREQNNYPSALEGWHRIARHRQRPNFAIATSYGLATIGDGTHLSGPSLETMGRINILDALYSIIAPQQIRGAYEGRLAVIDHNVVSSLGSPTAYTVDSPGMVFDVIENTADSYLDFDPLTVGRGGAFTVRHFSTNYNTHITFGAGLGFDPDTWQSHDTGPVDLAAGESLTIFKPGSSETGAFQVIGGLLRDKFEMDHANQVGNGSLLLGAKNFIYGLGWTVSFVPAESPTGRYVAVCADLTGVATAIDNKNLTKVDPGDTVVVEAIAKQAGATMSLLRQQVVFLSRALNELSVADSADHSAIGTSFERMSTMGIAPASTLYVRTRTKVEKTVGTLYMGEPRIKVIRRHEFFAPQWLLQHAQRTLTSTTAQQKIFNEDTTGDAVVEVGLYHFLSKVFLSSMSASAGSAGYGFLGSATVIPNLEARSCKVAVGTFGAQEVVRITSSGGITLGTANTNTDMEVDIQGLIEVTVAGTIIPAVNLGVAAAAKVDALSYAVLTRLPMDGASPGKLVMGPWA